MPDRRRAAIGLLALLPLAHPARAQTQDEVSRRIATLLGDPAAYAELLERLQQAVAAADAPAVAALLQLPIDVVVGGRRRRILRPEQFVAAYPELMTPHLQRVIRDQRFATLFVSQRGVMLGRGEVWLDGVCADAGCARSVPRVVALRADPP